MKASLFFYSTLISFFFISTTVTVSAAMVLDTCIVNDECTQALPIPGIMSDQSFVCVNGCNMYASPDSVIQTCQMSDFPTVWYTPVLDSGARVMNIEIRNADFESPVISVFKSAAGCASAEQVLLSSSNLSCIIGTGGAAKAIGIEVEAGLTYFIAISSLYSIGGNFELCVSALSTGSNCVIDRGIEITARSNSGPLEGPFDPGETVSVCLNVYSYTAAGNGCQWFQGIVPVFGNGWDPVSFDMQGQPMMSSINGDSIGETGNGLYGSTTWDWFTDVDYHHDHPSMTISDLDSNGRVDLCNSAHEIDCPHQGVVGGCCGPCWEESSGAILPGGWFAYGINGTCSTEGPPIRVDWGDGNTCSGGMGPWYFCFDLLTRPIPDCAGDTTRRDLTLGFYTFADGETGSWTGGASVCAYDTPTKLSLKAKCGRVSVHDTDVLDPLCTGDTLRYLLSSPNVLQWEWNISPFWAAPYLLNRGENGTMIEIPLHNSGQTPVDIHATLIGHEADSGNLEIRKFTFKLNPSAACDITGTDPVPGQEETSVRIYPMPAGEQVRVEWTFDIRQAFLMELYDACGVSVQQVSVPQDAGRSMMLDLAGMSPGVYYLSFQHSGFRFVKKLIRI